MDFNRLYSDHQKLLMEVARASSVAVRNRHEDAATSVADRIGTMQRELGADAAPGWELLAGSVQNLRATAEGEPRSFPL
ncbi:hypothetical protein [Tsuneonella sp. HG222]